MLTKKKKLSKKEIKEDKLVSFLGKTESFYEEYKSKIFLVAGVIGAVILLVFWYVDNQKTFNSEAGLELSRVMPLFDSGSYLEAIEGRQGTNIIGLKQIVEKYDGTPNGESAKIYLANCYSYLGNYEEAFKYFEDYSGEIPLYKASSYAGMAGYYASKNEYSKAADLYKKAANVTEINPQNPDYLLSGAINYIKVGQKEEAKLMLEKINEEYSDSEAKKQVEKYLALVES